MKRFTLCADDYALSPEVNKGILTLVQSGRVHAVSCLTESTIWPEAAKQLQDTPHEVQIGLHFNLTLPFGQSERLVSCLLADSISGRIDHNWARQRLDKQWEKFLRYFGRMPDFIDGHQHVHAFPGIRNVMIQYLRSWRWKGWVRSLASPTPFPADGLKRKVLSFATRPLPELLEFAGLPCNRHFAGFRPYRARHCFRSTFGQWLKHSPDGTLIMCHPASSGGLSKDAIRLCREQELSYLTTNEWSDDCHKMDVGFGPASHILTDHALTSGAFA